MRNINGLIVTIIVILTFTLAGFLVGGALMLKQSQRWENNYKIEQDSLVQKVINGISVSQTGVTVMDKAEVKKYMAEEWQLFAKDLKLKGIQQFQSMTAETTHKIFTTFKDSIVNDTTQVRVLDFNSRFLSIKGIQTGNELTATYKHHTGIKLAISKQPRDGFFNKIMFKPLVRNLQGTAVAEDTCTKITKLEITFVK